MSENKTPKNEGETNENKIQRNYIYPESEDIYNKAIKESDIDPENPAVLKKPNEEDEINPVDENTFELGETGLELDVPGAELDDEQEAIGSEDEENNYYSIGGDNHTDLEEDKGE